MRNHHSDLRYTAIWSASVWSSEGAFEAVPIWGLDPVAHLEKCRELRNQGYRRVSLTLARSTLERRLVTASIWHRPLVSEEVKDRLTKRQARAALF